MSLKNEFNERDTGGGSSFALQNNLLGPERIEGERDAGIGKK